MLKAKKHVQFHSWKQKEFAALVRFTTTSTSVSRPAHFGQTDLFPSRWNCGVYPVWRNLSTRLKYRHLQYIRSCGDRVDLTPFIREDLLLNLPAHPHCDRDGGRICKAKHIEMAEQETKGKSNWSELDKLKLKRK
ncbi:MAG: hypothetical protein DME66_03440 [Verrucomicrobia bacterium]|nr:MAG: hypothetical protein DME66_03440 [Verrucomicrobiota bacterium]